jgi:HipA-like protein
MPTEAEWSQKISAAASTRPQPVSAQTVLGDWTSTFSKPVKLSCSDGQVYVVKGRQVGRDLGRHLFNEHIVGRLGHIIGAPVGEVALVDVPSDLIAADQKLAHFLPGLAHGSRFVSGYSERSGFEHTTVQENRQRYATLCVLFSWLGAGDHQFIFQKSPPNLVYSVDHGHFFSENWTVESLARSPSAVMDPVFQCCALTTDELNEARVRLEGITEDDIAGTVGAPPDEWGVSLQDRIAMAEYLWKRRDELNQALRPVV